MYIGYNWCFLLSM